MAGSGNNQNTGDETNSALKVVKGVGKGAYYLFTPVGWFHAGIKMGKSIGRKRIKGKTKKYVVTPNNNVSKDTTYMTEGWYNSLGQDKKEIYSYLFDNKNNYLGDTRVKRIEANNDPNKHSDPILNFLNSGAKTMTEIKNNAARIRLPYKIAKDQVSLEAILGTLESKNYVEKDANNKYVVKKDATPSGDGNLTTEQRFNQQLVSKYCIVMDYEHPTGPKYVGVWTDYEKVYTNPDSTMAPNVPMIRVNPKRKHMTTSLNNNKTGSPDAVEVQVGMNDKRFAGNFAVINTGKGDQMVPLVRMPGQVDPEVTSGKIRVDGDLYKIHGVYTVTPKIADKK
jgi:hypothetical protein